MSAPHNSHMPEGHTIHRKASDHGKWFGGQKLRTSSPQGRFADEAAELDGRKLQRVEAYGKHLFYFWRGKTMHVHLGLYGRFRPIKAPFPEPRGAVRLRMTSSERGFDLVGPNCCELLTKEKCQAIFARLGCDPLRDDADPEKLWQRISKSRAALGRMLMDQSVFAGVGNIYRADALFAIGVHPESPGNALKRAKFDQLWEFLVRTMAIGKKYDRIINVTKEEVGQPYGKISRMRREERLLVYKKQNCIACDGPITKWELGARTVYACLRCQKNTG